MRIVPCYTTSFGAAVSDVNKTIDYSEDQDQDNKIKTAAYKTKNKIPNPRPLEVNQSTWRI